MMDWESPFQSALTKLNWERINIDRMNEVGFFFKSNLELCRCKLTRIDNELQEAPAPLRVLSVPPQMRRR